MNTSINFNQVKNLSHTMREMLKTWSKKDLVDNYYDARFGKGIFEGTASNRLSTILRCFAGEFKRRGIMDYL